MGKDHLNIDPLGWRRFSTCTSIKMNNPFSSPSRPQIKPQLRLIFRSKWRWHMWSMHICLIDSRPRISFDPEFHSGLFIFNPFRIVGIRVPLRPDSSNNQLLIPKAFGSPRSLKSTNHTNHTIQTTQTNQTTPTIQFIKV